MRTVTIRSAFWTPGIIIAAALLEATFIVGAIIQPGQALMVLVFLPLLMCLVGWLRLRSVRLEITESMVRVLQGWYEPDEEAPRGDITAIHFFPRMISFRGPDVSEPIMMIVPNYTLRQMTLVAAELEVPLYDHTRWHGLRKVSRGRLVYDPASGPVGQRK